MPGLQAARGASLITSETAAEPAGSTPGAGRSATPLALAVAAVALVVDVASKQLAVRELEGRDPVQVLGEVLQLTLVRNPGAAFSTGESFTPAISLVAVIATAVIVRLVFKVRHRGWAVALGLLLAGVSGNLVDRVFRAPGPLRGHVVDFFQLPHWPVFNVADICINAGAILMAILLFRGVHLDGGRDG
ncbi:MAG TPA: signal peptidase II [Marmoricola sp.]|nr:signal peptidase II [Marmoricola sp.]